MPIYEYTCHACGANFEHLHPSMKDITAPACPACASAGVRRRFSSPAIRTGGGAAAEPAREAPASAGKPEVFGRKELNAALRSQGIRPAKE
jgi:putative FmdB family regulatory protein